MRRPDGNLNRLTRLLGSFGFQQVILPPLEERKYFIDTELGKYFHSRIWPQVQSAEEILTISPTYFLSALRYHLNQQRIRGPYISKYFYIAAVWQGENLRPSWTNELGIFVFGDASVVAHMQLINALTQILTSWQLPEYLLELNSLGCHVCQKDYQDLTREHFDHSSYELCQNCRSNLEEQLLEVGRCGNARCRQVLLNIPPIVDFLDETCRNNLVKTLEAFDELSIPYLLDLTLGGLPLFQEQLIFRLGLPGKDIFLGQGGDYSHWAKVLGEESPQPLIGFLLEWEKLLQFVPTREEDNQEGIEAFIISLGETASRKALLLHRELLASGIEVGEAMLGNASIKNQLKEAGSHKSEITLIVGQKEAIDETVILRDMRSGMQEVFARERIVEEVKKRLGK